MLRNKYQLYYLKKLNSQNEEDVIYALRAIGAMRYKDAIPQLDKIIVNLSLSAAIRELASKVKDYLLISEDALEEVY